MSFITDLQEVEEIVVDWAYDLIKTVVDTLSPDGQQYALLPQTPEERLGDYLKLRGNSDAWSQWITSMVGEIMQRLHDAGLDEAQINSVHPWDIASRLAVHYSLEMEKGLLVK